MPESTALQIKFHYTLWDRIRSALVMSFQTAASTVWSLAFPAAGLALLGVHFYYGTPIGLGNAGLIVLCFGFSPFLLTYYAVKAHFFGEQKGKPFNYEFGEFGVRAFSDTTELTQSWRATSKVKLQSGFLLLFFSPRCAHCLPYRQLSELDAVEPIISMARAHGVRVYGI